jgi:hypothetical protein
MGDSSGGVHTVRGWIAIAPQGIGKIARNAYIDSLLQTSIKPFHTFRDCFTSSLLLSNDNVLDYKKMNDIVSRNSDRAQAVVLLQP